jgi:hypothetical protein
MHHKEKKRMVVRILILAKAEDTGREGLSKLRFEGGEAGGNIMRKLCYKCNINTRACTETHIHTHTHTYI